MKFKNIVRRFTSIVIASIMVLSLNMTAMATDCVPENVEVLSFTNDEGIMPLSSISGYGQQTITSEDRSILVWCDSDPGLLGGGMGITIKTSCSSGTFNIKATGVAEGGKGSSFQNIGMTTNDEIYFNNLNHRGPAYYVIGFEVPEGTPDFLVQVWIYG